MELSDEIKAAFQERLNERIEEQSKPKPGVIRGWPDEATTKKAIRGLPPDYSAENDIKTTILGLPNNKQKK